MPRNLPRFADSALRRGKALPVGQLRAPARGSPGIAAVILAASPASGRDRPSLGIMLRRRISTWSMPRSRSPRRRPAARARRSPPAGRRRDRRRRQGVGEDRLHLAMNGRRRVDAGEQRPVEVGRDVGAEGRDVGAQIGQRPHPQPQELAFSSSASSASVTWSRPCASLMKPSERSATHLIGRPTFLAAQVSTISSA